MKEGKVRCEECAAKEATRRLAAYYRQGKAQQAADLQQHKVRYARHKALGRCTDCGKTVSTGKRLCLDCSLRRRRYDKRFFDAHRRVDHSGNRECAGGLLHDEHEAMALAERLNKEGVS